MASATTAIRNRLKLGDLVIEVRDARIPLSSANGYLRSLISSKRRVIALNKKDLANPNIITQWTRYFDSCKQDCISINAHSTGSVKKLLSFVELKLKERIPKEPTLLVMVVGVPNVGKSALINSIHYIASSRSPVQEKMKRATVGPLPGVTQDIAGYKIAHQPSIYVLDSPGVLVPRIPDIETGLKLALTGSVKDSVVGEERLAKYLLAVLNTRKTPLRWSNLENRQEEKPGSEAVVDKNNIIREPFPRRTAQSNPSDVRSFEVADMPLRIEMCGRGPPWALEVSEPTRGEEFTGGSSAIGPGPAQEPPARERAYDRIADLLETHTRALDWASADQVREIQELRAAREPVPQVPLVADPPVVPEVPPVPVEIPVEGVQDPLEREVELEAAARVYQSGLTAFLKLHPPEFHGQTTDPLAPERWLIEVDKIFSIMHCTDRQRVSLATFMLKGSAADW